MEFIAAIDDSGNLDYLSIVMGEKSKIESIARKMPSSFTHMTILDRRTKKSILNIFEFKGNIKICCIKFGYSILKEEYTLKTKNDNSRKSMQKFYFNLALETKNNWQCLFKDFLIRIKLSCRCEF